jgi:hypothetical protein
VNLGLLPDRTQDFTFVLLSDRTGLARPGVFERAVELTNMLRPDFAIHIGDGIEGYTTDLGEVARQWDEFDAITAALEVPLFRVPGNHDVSNEPMRREWIQRHGLLHYHFVYRDVLFIVLDTSDPPQTLTDYIPSSRSASVSDLISELEALRAIDPAAATAHLESIIDWEGTMPARLDEEQVGWAEAVIAEHSAVRWTVVCMHMPAWQGSGHPALDRLRLALGDRPYTMFAGHVHNHRRSVIDGRDHIRLGPTGGMWVISDDEGNFDQVAVGTVSEAGLRVINLAVGPATGHCSWLD